MASNDWLEHLFPTIGAVNVARSKRAALQIAELVEDEHRLAQHADQCMTTILAGTRVSQRVGSRRAQPERVIEFAIGE